MTAATRPSTLIPLFPLHTVLFPGMVLPLRIFEVRYLDMVSAVLREGRTFGIVPIRQGSEVGAAPDFFPYGTLAIIDAWDRGADGLLQMRIIGGDRFHVLRHEVQSNQLLTAEITTLPPAADASLPADLAYLSALLREIFSHHMRDLPYHEPQFDSSLWVAYRLAEIVPLASADKLAVLQADSGIAALARVDARVSAIAATAPPGVRH